MRAVFLMLVIVSALAGASYAGARLAAGKLTGPQPNGLGPPSTHFEFSGIRALRAKPRGWVVVYPHAREFGRVEVYVSPTGQLLGTRPGDLAERLEARRAVEP